MASPAAEELGAHLDACSFCQDDEDEFCVDGLALIRVVSHREVMEILLDPERFPADREGA
jgi:hypothetical protein